MSLFGETQCIPLLASALIQTWALTLSAYQYTIVYRAGKGNANACHCLKCLLPFMRLQRLKLQKLSETPGKASQVKQWTEWDLVLCKVKTYLSQGWLNNWSLMGNARHNWDYKMVASSGGWESLYLPQIIEEVHKTHPGVSMMKSLARSYAGWPGMDLDLENKVKSCSQCQSNLKMSPTAPLHPWEWPDHPWLRLHLDLSKDRCFLSWWMPTLNG